jgi:hypothetical protein
MTSRQRLERTTKTAMPIGQPVKYPTTRRVAYTIFSLSQLERAVRTANGIRSARAASMPARYEDGQKAHLESHFAERGRSRLSFLVLGLLSSEVYDSCRPWIRRRSAGGDFSSR